MKVKELIKEIIKLVVCFLCIALSAPFWIIKLVCEKIINMTMYPIYLISEDVRRRVGHKIIKLKNKDKPDYFG
jgi:hypothetical protein